MFTKFIKCIAYWLTMHTCACGSKPGPVLIINILIDFFNLSVSLWGPFVRKKIF